MQRYVAALGRYKFLILGLGAVGVFVGVGLTKVIKPVYEAQAAVQIPPSQRGGGGGQGGVGRSAPLLEGRGWMELLRSFAVLDEVVRQRKLFLELDQPGDSIYFAKGLELGEGFIPGAYRLLSDASGKRLAILPPEGPPLDQVGLGDSLGRSIGFKWVPIAPPTGREVMFRVRVPRDAAVILNNDLTTTLPADGTLLRLSMRGGDPQATAAVVNAVASRFVDVAALLKREKLTAVTEAYREQLASARSSWGTRRSRSRATRSTRSRSRAIAGDAGPAGLQETRNPVAMRSSSFESTGSVGAIASRSAGLSGPRPTARRPTRSRSGRSPPSERRTSSRPHSSCSRRSARSASAAARLRADASRCAPRDREIEELAADDPGAGARARGQPRHADRDFDQRISASSREMQQIPARSTEEQRREREVEVAKIIYTELQSAYEQARSAEVSAAPISGCSTSRSLPRGPCAIR
jgi:succinoglycan biosynthesis transport protein ExoP